MEISHECCCGCVTQNPNKSKVNCPDCRKEGVLVNMITVEHLVTDGNRSVVQGEEFRICINEDCEIVYYNTDNNTKFLKEQVKVPIWFKKMQNQSMHAIVVK